MEGSGDDVFVLSDPSGTARFTHDGESNFIVEAVSESSGATGSAINEIGAYDGTVILRGIEGSRIALVQITADGGWTMTPR